MLLETFVQDLRFGLRVLIKEKSFRIPAAAFAASLGPTRRATLVNPLAALRAE